MYDGEQVSFTLASSFNVANNPEKLKWAIHELERDGARVEWIGE
jgi:hypothetical protein